MKNRRSQASRLRQEIRRAEEARRAHVDEIVEASSLVAGSFVSLGRKCGNPSCRCTQGEKHVGKFLSRSEGGKTRLVYVRAKDEVDIARKAERYREYRQARAELMKLAMTTAQLTDELQAVISEPYPADDDTTRKRRNRAKKSRAASG